jgi:hypothetical protein
MPTPKKTTKPKVSIKDLKPKKTAKGGAAIKLIGAGPVKITKIKI